MPTEKSSRRGSNAKVRFRERAELLDFLLEVSTVTSDTLDLDRLLARVGDFVADVIRHDLFAILLYSDKRKVLRIRYARGHREEVVHNLEIPLGEGVTGKAAETREPQIVNDVRHDPDYLNALDAVRSELAVPMVARGKLVGVIDVQSTQLSSFSDHDRALLRLIASRVASSIDNARLYRRVDRNHRTLRTLQRLSQEFSSILALDELLSRIAKRIRSLINYDAFSILMLDADKRLLRQRFSVRYDQRLTLDNIPLEQGITGAAAVSREAQRVADTTTDPRYIESVPGIHSELAIPLLVQDRVVGVLDLESERFNYFTEDHQTTLQLLAPQLASAIENARLYEELAQREHRMEEDLKAARKLQSVLLPRRGPDLEGLEIAIGTRPARDITGDVYDFFEYGEDQALLAFGDVSGKGAAAALYGALVSGLLRTLAPRRLSPAQLMKAINEALLERKVDAQYVTLMLMLWDRRHRTFLMSNAGGLPPMICRSNERVHTRAEGIPLGLLEDRQWDEITITTKPGDSMVLYSDGVQDQQNSLEQEYGDTRLFDVLRRACTSTPQDVVDAVFADLDQYRDGVPVFDDQTLIVIHVGNKPDCKTHIVTK